MTTNGVKPKPIAQGERLVANIYETPFDGFVGDGVASEGESYLSLDSSQAAGHGFHIYRMAPGASSTPHEHMSDEHFLVLEGDITDNDGYEYRAGDLVLLKKGTEHFSTSENGCTLAVFIDVPERNLAPSTTET